MGNEELISKMKEHKESFDAIWTKIVEDVNNYKGTHEGGTFYPFEYSDIDKFVDDLCLSGAWIKDRLNNKSGNTHAKEYRGSLTKGIRKALGYTL